MMNTNSDVTTNATPGNLRSMDEAELNQAMKRLKLLYIKARLLRADALFQAFVKAVVDARLDVQEFTDLMTDGTSEQIFAQAEKSEEVNSLGIKRWKHMDHPDWFKMDKE